MADVSPTGLPVIPPQAVPVIGFILGLAGLGAQFLPPHTIAGKICSAIFGASGLLGLLSPGLRTQPPPQA